MKSLHPVSENPPPERTRAFWNGVRFFIETIWSLFGGPESIAALRTITREDHKLLCSWLRKGEALVRKLLIIEAAELHIAEKKYKQRAAIKREKQARYFNEDEPHAWRVSFCVTEGTERDTYPFARQKVRVPERLSQHRFCEARPLAERFEALLRVFDAPELYIKRAARLLRRCGAKIQAFAAVPLFEGYEDFFDPLRPLLGDVFQRFSLSDTS